MGGVDDDVLPSGAHPPILPLAAMIAGAAGGERAFDLIEPGGVGRGEVERGGRPQRSQRRLMLPPAAAGFDRTGGSQNIANFPC